MAIEFQCIRCGQHLRVTDSDSGKRARCPTCNAVVDVPSDDVPASPIVMIREKSDVIDYELFGNESQYVEITLDPGEITAARMENLVYMSPGIAMENAITEDSNGGGILDKISQVGRRILAGSSLRMTAFCNVAEQREVVAFAPALPGRLIPLHMDEYGKQLTCQTSAILCVARGIEIGDVEIAGLSDVLQTQQITGDGIAVLQVANQFVHRQLTASKIMVVKTAKIVAFTSDVRVTPHESVGVEEQTTVSAVRGPGEIWLRTGI
jgi:uncharacterized protein (AIM24 family)